ncbi:MAG: ornithine carbamoyltransferase [Limnochordia bacterium]|nr:ornithine carbamoyltransferase [Limnochordia bacterium]MDD2629593.1 ornithine carbamoyltransferase [Limnochordia bacterium]MDD4517303.1 ornithine carbamoyltransferase [Limnochordia bacterium]
MENREVLIPNDEITESLRGRSFLRLYDFSPQELTRFLEVAQRLKKAQKMGQPHGLLAGKSLGMIFRKTSTRTRVSFEVGIYQLGGRGLYLNSDDIQLGRGESVYDTAMVLSRYLDGIMIRTFEQAEVDTLAQNATIPVINGLTDFCHPCQVLSDLFTIQEKRGRLQGLKLAYVGDGNNMAHSLMVGCSKMGVNVSIAYPPGYAPNAEVVEWAKATAQEHGSLVELTTNPYEGVAGADVIYTDVWTSMGQEAEEERRLRDFGKYQVNQKLVQSAKPDVMVMHCLPANRGQEITDEVMDGPNSIVFDQAENRLHAQKAIMALLMG